MQSISKTLNRYFHCECIKQTLSNLYDSIVLPIFFGIGLHLPKIKERIYEKISKDLDQSTEKTAHTFQDRWLVPYLLDCQDNDHFKAGFKLLTPKGQLEFFDKVKMEQLNLIFDYLKEQTEFYVNLSFEKSSSKKSLKILDFLNTVNNLKNLHLQFDHYSKKVEQNLAMYQVCSSMEETEQFEDKQLIFGFTTISITNTAKAIKTVKEIITKYPSVDYELKFKGKFDINSKINKKYCSAEVSTVIDFLKS